MSVSFEFFEGLDLRVFYRVARAGSLERAVREAVRREDGYEARVERRPGVIEVRMRGPIWGRAVKTFEVREGEIPRAWAWWTPPPLRRGWVIAWEREDGSVELFEGPSLDHRQVYCDVCGAWIAHRPVPILLGSHALCSRCMRNVTGVSLDEAARMDGVALQWLDEEQP
jgi:hypothetical protein